MTLAIVSVSPSMSVSFDRRLAALTTRAVSSLVVIASFEAAGSSLTLLEPLPLEPLPLEPLPTEPLPLEPLPLEPLPLETLALEALPPLFAVAIPPKLVPQPLFQLEAVPGTDA